MKYASDIILVNYYVIQKQFSKMIVTIYKKEIVSTILFLKQIFLNFNSEVTLIFAWLKKHEQETIKILNSLKQVKDLFPQHIQYDLFKKKMEM